MNKKEFESRIRQLSVSDANVIPLYEDIVKIISDKILKEQFMGICEDEKRHVALSEQILSLLKE